MWKLNGKKSRSSASRLETLALAQYVPGFEVSKSNQARTPLIIASPHSGRIYADGFMRQTPLSLPELRLGEDCYIDTIFKPTTQHGAAFLQALFPRCFVDVNRHEAEWPPESFVRAYPNSASTSARARSGLGVIPTRVSRALSLYTHNLQPQHIQARLDALYHPYHTALKGLIDNAQTHFDRALLLDCHSMPGEFVSGVKRADFILGDRYGQSCHTGTIDTLHTKLCSLGYHVTRNVPYAGGYITQHYGQPDTGTEAIQIEINKDLYLNPHTLEPHAGMDSLVKNMDSVVLHMIDTLAIAPPLAAQ